MARRFSRKIPLDHRSLVAGSLEARYSLAAISHYVFIFLILVAAILRVYCLSCSSLWHDEGNTWALMDRSFAQIAADAAADIHPPGYYWLLKIWTTIFGADVEGLRSFSVVAGMLTVAVVYGIARTLIGQRGRALGAVVPLLAAFLAAIHPFQIYYSQEARMYALLMLESSVLFWALLGMMEQQENAKGKRQKAKGRRASEDLGNFEVPSRHSTRHPQFTIHNSQFAIHNSSRPLYVLAAVAGLWTHYIFPVMLAAASGAYLWHWWRTFRPRDPARRRTLTSFVLLNAAAVAAFLPWLPTALARVLAWPAGGADVSLFDGARLIAQTLLVGPIRSAPSLGWITLALGIILPLIGLWRLRHPGARAALGLWLLAPIAVMLVFGLIGDAFLKFLLVASPAWCLLVASVPAGFVEQARSAGGEDAQSRATGSEHVTTPGASAHGVSASSPLRLFASLALVIAGVWLGAATLPAYYADPAARDNYAGIAQTVAALGDPASSLVVLDAPGQQEVWAYYDPGVPVLALPRQRPADRAATESLLAEATADREQIFALFWATDQSDPERIVEAWLDRHAFKGLESWQGNVRFVGYALPGDLPCGGREGRVRFGAAIVLRAVCRNDAVYSPGESIPVQLQWQAQVSLEQRYKVTLQLLDERGQVIAQRDGEPAGGSRPTVTWQPGETIVDNQAIFVPPGTPPGVYRLLIALYDAESGERLPVTADGDAGGDALPLGTVTITRPDNPLPSAIVPMQQRVDRPLGAVRLLGYDLHKRGVAHAPHTPLAPGDRFHVTLYWQAPDPLPADWPGDLTMTLTLGDQQVTAPLAGGLHPTGAWRAGDLVRGEFDLLYDGGESTVWLAVAEERLRLGTIPTLP